MAGMASPSRKRVCIDVEPDLVMITKYKANVLPDDTSGPIWSSDWHFRQSYCLRESINARWAGEFKLEEDNIIMMVVDKEQHKAPDKESLLTWLCAYEILYRIDRHQPCSACATKIESVRDHFDGCMRSPYEKIALYFDTCVNQVKWEKIQNLYLELLKLLAISNEHSQYQIDLNVMNKLFRDGNVRNYLEALTHPDALFPDSVRYLMDEAFGNVP